MKQTVWFLLGMFLVLPLACKGNPQKGPQTIAKIEELKQELAKTKTAVEDAQNKDSEYAGGLIKALIGVRIEILKTNEALIQQRIQTLESGVPIKIQIYGTTPNEQRAASLEKEIQAKRIELAEAKKEMEQYSGGLVLAMKASAAATIENTIAMMEQERIISKYGLSYKTGNSKNEAIAPPQAQPRQSAKLPVEEIISVKITNKRYAKEEYKEYIWLDAEWIPVNLKKPTRSVKGILQFCDLFGDVKFIIQKTINLSLKPGESLTEPGIGFEYNQFKDEEIWLRQTDIKDMTFKFRVTNILYEDGEREDY